MNINAIFEIKLEDYCRPRYESAIRSYYGTGEDINDLMERLKNIAGASDRYQETIMATEYYDFDEDITHTIAGKELQLLKQVQEICRYQTSFMDHYWDYFTNEGTVFHCYAAKVDACQVLICTDSGYERCIRASFSNLCVHHHGVGWINPCDHMKGFPGMVTWDGEHHNLSLFISQAHYEPNEFNEAITDTVSDERIDLSAAVSDILAEG